MLKIIIFWALLHNYSYKFFVSHYSLQRSHQLWFGLNTKHANSAKYLLLPAKIIIITVFVLDTDPGKLNSELKITKTKQQQKQHTTTQQYYYIYCISWNLITVSCEFNNTFNATLTGMMLHFCTFDVTLLIYLVIHFNFKIIIFNYLY